MACRRAPCLCADSDLLRANWYNEPTIVDCPNQQISVIKNQLFDPVVSALTFPDKADTLTLADDANFSLACGIFTPDVGRALRISKAIRTGISWVCTCRTVSPVTPFGGYEDSNYGRESGMEVIYDYTRPKTGWLNISADPLTDLVAMHNLLVIGCPLLDQ